MQNALVPTLVPDDTMSPQQVAAIKNNEKVFPVFEKKLSSDNEDLFCVTTIKLSTWLNSEKAYYAEARPKIVKLLEIAQATVCRQKGGDQNEPIHAATYPPHLARWVNSYAALIRTVVRFSGMFSEKDLQKRLQPLFHTGSIKPPSTNTPQVLPTQQIVPTQQAVVPSDHQRAPQQNQNQTAEGSSAGPSTAIRTPPLQDGRATPAQSHSRPISRPSSTTTMHPSSSSLASTLDVQNSTLSPGPSRLPSKSPMGLGPVVPSPAATPSPAPPAAIQAQIGRAMTAGADHQFPIVLDSNPNFVEPSHASPVPSQVPVHSSTALSAPFTVHPSPLPILPTIPTPSQVLSTFSRPQLPPIRIPPRPQSQRNPVQATSTPPSVPASIPATSTQPAQAIPSSSFSPIPNPSSASASTSSTPAPAPAPAATKKKKIAISEDLALADLEWFKAKQQKKGSEGTSSKASKASAVTPAPAASATGKEVKVASVPENRAISDLLWLEMKGKKGSGATHKATAGGKGEGKVATSSVAVEPRQEVDRPSSVETETTSEFGLKSTMKVSKYTSDIPVERTVDTVSSSSITNVSSSVLMSDDTPGAVARSDRNQASSCQPDPAAPMDVDQPPSETGVGVAVSPQTVEQPSGDALSAVPAPSTNADLRTAEDVEMLPAEAASNDGTAVELSMTTSTDVGSVSTVHQADANAITTDDHMKSNALTNQVALPVGDLSGEQPVINEEITSAHDTRGDLPVATESVEHPATEAVYQDMQGLSLDNKPNESSVIGETAVEGEVIILDATEKSGTLHGASMPPASSNGVPSTNLQPALAENEAQTISPSLTVPESVACPPSPSNSTSIHARSISLSTSMDISPLPELRSNDRPMVTRKRPRSPSLYADSDNTRRSPASSRVLLDTVTNEPITQPMKHEVVSETDVLKFLDTVPLGSKTSADNGLPQSMIAPTREPRRIDFGPEMVVIAARRGSSSGVPMTIHFEINDIQLSLISLWQRWDKTSDDVSQSMCLTLACYLWVDLLPEVQRVNGSPSLEKLLPAARCSWPTKGGVSMIVQRGQDDWHLPLSPPFHESSENLVDVSRFVKLQHNTIRILQRSDMSDFVFALHAHFPTRRQLEVVTRRRTKDSKWHDDLKYWSRQLDAPVPPVWSNICNRS